MSNGNNSNKSEDKKIEIKDIRMQKHLKRKTIKIEPLEQISKKGMSNNLLVCVLSKIPKAKTIKMFYIVNRKCYNVVKTLKMNIVSMSEITTRNRYLFDHINTLRFTYTSFTNINLFKHITKYEYHINDDELREISHYCPKNLNEVTHVYIESSFGLDAFCDYIKYFKKIQYIKIRCDDLIYCMHLAKELFESIIKNKQLKNIKVVISYIKNDELDQIIKLFNKFDISVEYFDYTVIDKIKHDVYIASNRRTYRLYEFNVEPSLDDLELISEVHYTETRIIKNMYCISALLNKCSLLD